MARTINYSALSSWIHHGCLYRWNDHSRSAQGHSWASHSPGWVRNQTSHFCACLLYQIWFINSSTSPFPPASQATPLAMPRFLEGPVIEWAWRAYGSCHNPLLSQHRRESSQFVSWLEHSNSKHTNCQNWWHCSWRYLEKACTFPENNNLGILASTIQTVTHQDWHSKYRLLTYHILEEIQVVQLLWINICHLSFFFQSVALLLLLSILLMFSTQDMFQQRFPFL